MDWTTEATCLPIHPGDLVWGHTPEGLTRHESTAKRRGEYLALDDERMRIVFDRRLADLLGFPEGPVIVSPVTHAWLVAAGGQSIVLPVDIEDPLLARVLLWRKASLISVGAERDVTVHIGGVPSEERTQVAQVIRDAAPTTAPEALPPVETHPPSEPDRRSARKGRGSPARGG